MTMTHDYSRLHRAVDRLDPAQARAMLDLLKTMLGEQVASDPSPQPEDSNTAPKQHRLSFTGIAEGPGDLSERVDEYLRGMGEPRS